MKIGILTFHRADNFGAALQSYALQTYLQRKGYDARIVDYRCEACLLYTSDAADD